jgi:hypothetical protein
VENLAGGNVRSALGYVNTFVGSGHVDTAKILEIEEVSGAYYVPLHEFVGHHLRGLPLLQPSSSPIANVYEISRPDAREHFRCPSSSGMWSERARWGTSRGT